MTLPVDPVQDIEVSLFSCIACIIHCVCIVDSVVMGLSLFIGSVSQQTSQLSSYEVTVPRRISRQRRNQDSADKVNKLSLTHTFGF